MATPSSIAWARFVTSLPDSTTHYAKVGYLMSLVIGFWMLHAYCVSEGVPMPVPDTSLLVFLAVLAAACFIIVLLLAVAPLGIFLTVAHNPEFRALRPTGSAWPPSRQDTFCFAKRLVLTFLPFLLSSSLAYLIIAIGGWRDPGIAAKPAVFWGYRFVTVIAGARLLSFVAGVAISTFCYKWHSERFFSGNTWTPTDVRAFAGASVEGSCAAWIWMSMVTVIVLFLTLGTPLLKADASVLNLLWIYGVLVLWWAGAWFLLKWERYKEAFAFGAAIVTIGMVLCAARLGGITLRAIGYGGGLPISLVARVMQPDSATAPAEEISGCLVLWTSEQVTLLHPVDKRVALPRRHLNPLTQYIVDGHPIATRMDTIRREDVRDILFVRKRP